MKINNFEFDFRIRKTVKFTVSSWHNYMDSLASLTRLSIGYLFATICSQRCLRFGSNELHKWCTQTESQKWTFPLIKRSYVTLLILSQMSYTHTQLLKKIIQNVKLATGLDRSVATVCLSHSRTYTDNGVGEINKSNGMRSLCFEALWNIFRLFFW